jgi:hypothetical protein
MHQFTWYDLSPEFEGEGRKWVTNCGNFRSERSAWSVGITLSDHVPRWEGRARGFATRGIESRRAEETLSKVILREFMKHL